MISYRSAQAAIHALEQSERPEDEENDPPKFLQAIVAWSDFWNGEWTRQRSTRVHKWAKTASIAGGMPLESIFMKVYKNGYGPADDGLLWVELSHATEENLPDMDPEGGIVEKALDRLYESTYMFARYRYDDCTDRLRIVRPDDLSRGYTADELWAPQSTRLDAQAFASTQVSNDFFSPVIQEPIFGVLRTEPVLQVTKTPFRVVYPHAHVRLHEGPTRLPRFFFGDEKHTFYVVQREVPLPFDEDRVPVNPSSSAPPHPTPPSPPIPVLPDPSPIPEGIPLTLDGVQTASLWGGAVPGFAQLTLAKGKDPTFAVASTAFATKALSNSIATLSASTATTAGTLAIAQTHLENRFHFSEFHHPFTCLFLIAVNRWGIDGLLAPPDAAWILKRQILFVDYFSSDYQPTVKVGLEYPIDDIDFRYGGAYSTYNWELFFHAPVLIAKRLTTDQRFEDAMRWYHYVFNPMDTSELTAPARFWNIKPFFFEAQQFAKNELLVLLGYEGTAAEQAKAKKDFYDQVNEWRKKPFLPHLIARMRPEAYAKSVVMSYLDNLIAWADSLFRRDTIETINEATQLYVLAAEILAARGERVDERAATTQGDNHALRQPRAA